MQIIELDNLKRNPTGDALEDLVNQVKGLRAMRDALDRQDGLYLSTKDGQVFGQLLKDEARETRKRIREKIESQIEKTMKEIRKHVDAF